MRSTASIQIGFKVSPEIAEKLEELGKPLRLSRSLVAKELVLAALASGTSGQAIDLVKHRITTGDSAANGEPDEQERTEAEDLMQDLLKCLGVQAGYMENLAVVVENLTLLRGRELPALRNDLRTSVRALLCQGGATNEQATEWVMKNLSASPPKA